MPLHAAFSPCPNDTFLLGPWVAGAVGDLSLQVQYADIQHLNEWARSGRYPLCKISLAHLPHLLDEYVLLPVGAALGWQCGPLLIARAPFDLSQLGKMRVAVPGVDTTAHRILQTVAPPPKEKRYCLFSESAALLAKGVVDAAVIIHEQRFTYQEQGFVEVADLGALWHEKFGLPVPLGGVVAKRSLGPSRIAEIIDHLRRSLSMAWQNPGHTRKYVLRYAQEMEESVVDAHIATYVTEETYALTPQAQKAIEHLFTLSGSHLPPGWLFQANA